MKYTSKDIDNYFTYHNPANIDPLRFIKIRDAAKFLGQAMIENGGEEDDIDRALQMLRTSVHFAIASIVVPKIGT